MKKIIYLVPLTILLFSCANEKKETLTHEENKTEKEILPDATADSVMAAPKHDSEPEIVVEELSEKSDTITVEGVIVNAYDTGIYGLFGIKLEPDDGKRLSFDYDGELLYQQRPLGLEDHIHRRASIRYYFNQEKSSLTIVSLALYEKVERLPLNSIFIGEWVVSAADLNSQNDVIIKINYGRDEAFRIDFGEGFEYYRTDVTTNTIEGDNSIGRFKLELLTENPATLKYSVLRKGEAEPTKDQLFDKVSNEYSQLIIGKWQNVEDSADMIEFTNKEFIRKYYKRPYVIGKSFQNKYHREDYSDRLAETPYVLSELNLNGPIGSSLIKLLNETHLSFITLGIQTEFGEDWVSTYKRVQ